jgi:hypothetical protein
MKVERYKIQACCGRTSIIFKTDRPIIQKDVESLEKLGFKTAPIFLKAGILYMNDLVYIISAPLGSDRLSVKLKKEQDQAQKLNDIEDLLKTIG